LLIFLCKLQFTQLFPFLVYHDEFFFSLPIHVIHHGPYDIVLLIRHNKFLRFASVPPFCCNRPFKCHKYFPLFYFFMKNLENPKQKYENIQKCIDSKKLWINTFFFLPEYWNKKLWKYFKRHHIFRGKGRWVNFI
jgi:hypothetical protein